MTITRKTLEFTEHIILGEALEINPVIKEDFLLYDGTITIEFHILMVHESFRGTCNKLRGVQVLGGH